MYYLKDIGCTYIDYSSLPYIPLSKELDKYSGSTFFLFQMLI